MPTIIDVHVGVYLCLSCEHYLRACPPFLRPKAIYTNRVIATAVASVFEDGMAISRVSRRMARDFWIRPNESIIRLRCRTHIESIQLEQDYQPWVVSSFSGVLCVDEVYQGKLALLLAVDPDEDRLVGYQLLHGSVSSQEAAEFLQRLADVGISPEQVVTDGAAIYPESIAAVWPQAAHQMCLFHQTRLMVKAAQKTVREVAKLIPKQPALPRKGKGGQLKTKTSLDAAKRAERIAIIFALHKKGTSLRQIVRKTGHSINTVRSWLRGTVSIPKELLEVNLEEVQVPFQVSDNSSQEKCHLPRPPEPCESWEQVEECRQDLKAMRAKLIARSTSLNEEELERLRRLLFSPLHEELGIIRGFVERWYAIWWGEDEKRNSPEEAQKRFEIWQTYDKAKCFPELKRLQRIWTKKEFERLSFFLQEEHWKSTSNAAERAARQFRHLQSVRYNWRSLKMIEGILDVYAMNRMRQLTETNEQGAIYSKRGRPSKDSESALSRI